MNEDKSKRELTYREYIQRESNIPRAEYDPEMSFYDNVRMGNVERVAQLCEEPLSEKEGMGQLSDNEVSNIRYYFVITAAMLARACIDGGMELSLAYTLSDYYIRLADTMRTVDAINKLHPVMCLDYARRMRNIRRGAAYSRYVLECIEYIYSNLHTRITLRRLSEVCGISESHLSRLFRKETGMSVSGYIAERKLETAENMLAYSDYTIAHISHVLAFADQSYFTECFKKRTGMTPLQYRNRRHSFSGRSG